MQHMLRSHAQIFGLDDRIDTIDDRYWIVRAEGVPPEEATPPAHSRRIHVYHFSMQNNNVRARAAAASAAGQATRESFLPVTMALHASMALW
jgi:hypothetical protein